MKKTSNSKRKVLKYITHNLDEATYLIIKGLKATVQYRTPIASEFTFVLTPSLEKYRKEFWKKGCKIEIHTWITTRTAVKLELRAQGQIIFHKKPKVMSVEEKEMVLANAKPLTTPTPGEAYWFVTNGLVGHALYGPNPVHKIRFESGNAFRTKEEALLVANLNK